MAEALTLRERVLRRCEHAARVGADPRRRAAEWAVCARGVTHWVNRWCWTYDNRDLAAGVPAERPFDLFPRQEEFLRWLAQREANQEDGLVVKSREVGLTWLCVAYATHGLLFRPGFSCGFGSRKLDLVDRLGDLDSILEKARYLLRRLPAWMLPAGFDFDRHAGRCRLLNPETGASITGEGGDEIGRGGRKSMYVVDEAAHLEHPEQVDAALSQTTRVRIDVSTPNGAGNPFAHKFYAGKVKSFSFHWRDDPRKGDAWFARECDRLGHNPAIIAQELEMDFTASRADLVIPGAWVRAAVGLKLPAGKGCVAGWDVADEAGVNVVTVRRGPVVLPPASRHYMTTVDAAWWAAGEAERLGAATLFYDSVGVGAHVKGTFARAPRKPRFALVAVCGSASPTGAVWPDGRTSREMFANLRAELWWLLRLRFEQTFEYVTARKAHPPGELISLPDCPQLVRELSLPTWRTLPGGKVQVEGKRELRARGVKSPDYADSLCYSFAPLPPAPRRAAAVAGDVRYAPPGGAAAGDAPAPPPWGFWW